MTKNKTKMISIRVSEDDYLMLKSRYELHGTRSVSALAREALTTAFQRQNHPAGELEAEVRQLSVKLVALQNEVSRLSRIVEQSLGPEAAD